MASAARAHIESVNPPRASVAPWVAVILTLLLQLVMGAYTYGRLTQSSADIEKRLDRIERLVDRPQASIQTR